VKCPTQRAGISTDLYLGSHSGSANLVACGAALVQCNSNSSGKHADSADLGTILAAITASGTAASARRGTLAGPLVSIIDDDEDVRQSLEALVESVGYSVRLFEGGEAFLASDALAQTACIVSDIQMAGMTGVALVDHLARSGYRVPVILISAYPNNDILRGITSTCVVAVLPKPLLPNTLIDRIKHALDNGS
jgi:CheY-like chemotaxis protein